MALTKDTPRAYAAGIAPHTVELPIEDTVTIFEGGALMEDESDGLAIPLVGTGTSNGFVGFAERGASGPNGDTRALVRSQGFVELNVTGGAEAALGAAVYATDDGTFTTTSTNAKRIGQIVQHVTSTICLVWFYSYTMTKVAHA